MEASGAFRTPDERFAALPDFPWQPNYVESDGLRVAYIDEGTGPIVFLLHGMPSWSYLWRHVIPPLLEAGYRCVAPDLIGFGRSDKPTSVADYTYPRHVAAMVAVLDAVAPDEPVHFALHDWGGPIGSLVAADNQDRIASTTMMDTGFNTGDFKMSETWQAFRDFVATADDIPIGFLIKGAVARGLEDDVFAAYEAPFPTPESKAGARAFPPMIPTSEDHPDAVEGRRALEAFAAGGWPKLVLWADKDPVLPRKLGDVLAARINAGSAITIEDAGHFLQEDAGTEIGERIANFLTVSAA
ncbi:MAG: alpha/beta fold hydrolase [Thermoleophilaceae bacterium]|nr:alpha/beta fold hydrolase [Thermoleophilaceae bacterium]